MKHFILRSFIALSLFIVVERFCHKQTDGFRIQKIQSALSYNPNWDIEQPPPEQRETIDSMLSQPYTYMGSGGQCYAFVSKDKKTVLKLFKHHHMRPKNWIDHIPLPSLLANTRMKWRKNRQGRLDSILGSCKLAYDHLREETGLLYLHLNKTDTLQKKITLYDAIGAIHHLELDKLEFALQKKATLAYPTLSALIETGELEAAKVRLTSFIQLIVSRCKAGIADHDPRKRNFGFVEEKAIEIDLGSFSKNEELKNPAAGKKILLYETMKLRRWIQKNYPELSSFLEEQIHKEVENDR